MSKEFNIENYKSIVEIKVRYDDLDTLGHVNNKTYLSYLEESRIKYMADVLEFNMNSLDFDVVVGKIEITYSAPLFLNDDVFVYTRISRIGEKSFDFECIVVKKIKEQIIATAFSVVTLVSVNSKTGKTKPNEQKMIDAILAFEKIKPKLITNRA